MKFLRVMPLLVVVSAVVSTGCSNYSASHEYYKARPEAKLEIPPGLTRPMDDKTMDIPEKQGVTTYSSYAGGGCKEPQITASSMPKQEMITLKREGPYLWLVANAEPEQVWPVAQQFVQNKGFKLEREDTRLGLMETEWVEKQELDTVPLRERFRLRFEYGQLAGTTEIYLSQQMQSRDGKEGLWQPQPADPESELTMLKSLAQFLGASSVEFKETEVLKTEVQLQDRGKEGMSLVIQADFQESWKRAIKVMENLGATVEERSINQRFLIARFEDKKERSVKSSWLGKVMVPSEKHALSRFRFEFFDRQDGGTTLQIQDLQAKPAKGDRPKSVMEQLEQALGEL
jgi:outer membrane protein assembly factor BamC